MAGNVEPTKSAPVTALFAYDTRFADKMPKLLPGNAGVIEFFKDQKAAHETAVRNATLQAAYFMVVARSKGLDCGPMSGFDPIKQNGGMTHHMMNMYMHRAEKSKLVINLGPAHTRQPAPHEFSPGITLFPAQPLGSLWPDHKRPDIFLAQP